MGVGGLMAGAKSRNKGAAWEREVAHILTERFGVECRRRVKQYQVGGSDIDTVLPIAVECKTGYRIDEPAALEQARAAAGPLELPFVYVKRNVKNGKPDRYIVIHEQDFLPILIEHLRPLIEAMRNDT